MGRMKCRRSKGFSRKIYNLLYTVQVGIFSAVCLSSHRYTMKNLTLYFLLLCCLGCASKTNKPIIHISLINQNRSLKLTGFDYAIVQELNRDSATANWQSLVPVYRMPADTDMKDYQSPQPGKYTVADSTVTFTPDTPFLQHQTYFVRFYQYAKGSNMWDHVKQHKKLGDQPYTDLIFKQ